MTRLQWLMQQYHNARPDPDACVNWPFSTNNDGYPARLNVKGEIIAPHRLICRLHRGFPDNDGLQAAHYCGNSLCVNPHHLRWATPVENNHEKRTHYIHKNGEIVTSKQGVPTFSEVEVSQIVDLCKYGFRQKEVGEMFGVTGTTVGHILHNRSYRIYEPKTAGYEAQTMAGDLHPNAALTEQQVRQIVEHRKNGVSVKQLSHQFKVGGSVISNITGGRTWTHLNLDLSQIQRSHTDGSEHASTKVSEAEIQQMKDLRKIGWTLQRIADLYQVSVSTVHKVSNYPRR